MKYKKRIATAIVGVATLSGVFLVVPQALAAPPEPPGVEETKQTLASITPQDEGSRDGYDRDKFPHWSDQGDNCDTRDVVLKRDGENVQTDDECEPTSGTWYSRYDDQTLDSQDDIQIDHIIALAESWDSGTNAWTNEERERFANDLEHSQLVAVSGTSNGEKSDKDPAEWMPANTEIHCLYVREWIWVKSTYNLTIDQAEYDVLEETLNTKC